MTNSLGITFVRGEWYNCNYSNHFFQYWADREDRTGGVYTIAEYKHGEPIGDTHDYIANRDYLDRATLATPEELVALGVIPPPRINDSYSVF